MLDVIKSRGLPLDRITTTDVWATDTIPANLPPMMAFKERMDQRIWEMYHIEVEHLCALNKDGSKRTYEQMFYHVPVRRSQTGQVEREQVSARSGYRIPGSRTSMVSDRTQEKSLPDAGQYYRIPSQHRIQLVPEAQTLPGQQSRVFHWQRELHIAKSSRPEQRHNGFPAQISPWCRKLKIDKVRTPFRMSAPRGAKTEISWNTWASQRMSRNGSDS